MVWEFSVKAADKTKPGETSSTELDQFQFHCYVTSDGLAGVLVASNAYPKDAAYKRIEEMLADFDADQAKVFGDNSESWKQVTMPDSVSWPGLEKYGLRRN